MNTQIASIIILNKIIMKLSLIKVLILIIISIRITILEKIKSSGYSFQVKSIPI